MNIIATIVTYNRKQLLLECISAVLHQTYPLQEVIILDNASTDGTQEALQDAGVLSNPIIKYVRSEINSGGAGGFYAASKQAYRDGADWIWMMDDDCLPEPTALEALVSALDVVDAGFLCSTVRGEDGGPNNVPGVKDRGDWYQYLADGLVKVTDATFVSFFFSRQAVERCGLPYKNYFIWGDDAEYSSRITKYFKPGYFVGKSKVIHKVVPGGGVPGLPKMLIELTGYII